MADFSQAIQRGGMVTVMNAAIFDGSAINLTNASNPAEAYKQLDGKELISYIDHFKTANLNASGPTITITGGQSANPLIKFGKTMKCEMNMALCQIDALVALGGVQTEPNYATASCGAEAPVSVGDRLKAGTQLTVAVAKSVEYEDGTLVPTTAVASGGTPFILEKDGIVILAGDTAKKIIKPVFTAYSVTNKFPGAVTILGDTFVVDQKSGDQVAVKILIYKFLPDAIFNLTQDASNAATFDMNGDVLGVNLTKSGSVYNNAVFYSIIDPTAGDLKSTTENIQAKIDAYKTIYQMN